MYTDICAHAKHTVHPPQLSLFMGGIFVHTALCFVLNVFSCSKFGYGQWPKKGALSCCESDQQFENELLIDGDKLLEEYEQLALLERKDDSGLKRMLASSSTQDSDNKAFSYTVAFNNAGDADMFAQHLQKNMKKFLVVFNQAAANLLPDLNITATAAQIQMQGDGNANIPDQSSHMSLLLSNTGTGLTPAIATFVVAAAVATVFSFACLKNVA